MKLIKSKPRAEEALVPLMNALFKADQSVRKFLSENEQIFTQYQKLKEAREVAENELRTESKRIGTGYETERVSCEYVMPQHKYYDPQILRERVSKRILDSLEVIRIEERVDEKILKMLVRANKIKKSVMQAAYRETPTGSPRVTITIKEESE